MYGHVPPDGRIRPRYDADRLPARYQGGVRRAGRETGVFIDSEQAITRLGPPLEEELAYWFPGGGDPGRGRPVTARCTWSRDRADAGDAGRGGGDGGGAGGRRAHDRGDRQARSRTPGCTWSTWASCRTCWSGGCGRRPRPPRCGSTGRRSTSVITSAMYAARVVPVRCPSRCPPGRVTQPNYAPRAPMWCCPDWPSSRVAGRSHRGPGGRRVPGLTPLRPGGTQ